MGTDKNFEEFINETLQLEELADVIGGIETEYSISLTDIEAHIID